MWASPRSHTQRGRGRSATEHLERRRGGGARTLPRSPAQTARGQAAVRARSGRARTTADSRQGERAPQRVPRMRDRGRGPRGRSCVFRLTARSPRGVQVGLASKGPCFRGPPEGRDQHAYNAHPLIKPYEPRRRPRRSLPPDGRVILPGPHSDDGAVLGGRRGGRCRSPGSLGKPCGFPTAPTARGPLAGDLSRSSHDGRGAPPPDPPETAGRAIGPPFPVTDLSGVRAGGAPVPTKARATSLRTASGVVSSTRAISR